MRSFEVIIPHLSGDVGQNVGLPLSGACVILRLIPSAYQVIRSI